METITKEGRERRGAQLLRQKVDNLYKKWKRQGGGRSGLGLYLNGLTNDGDFDTIPDGPIKYSNHG